MKMIMPHSDKVGMLAAVSMGSHVSVSSLQVVSTGQGLVHGSHVQFGASQVSTPLQNNPSLSHSVPSSNSELIQDPDSQMSSVQELSSLHSSSVVHIEGRDVVVVVTVPILVVVVVKHVSFPSLQL